MKLFYPLSILLTSALLLCPRICLTQQMSEPRAVSPNPEIQFLRTLESDYFMPALKQNGFRLILSGDIQTWAYDYLINSSQGIIIEYKLRAKHKPQISVYRISNTVTNDINEIVDDLWNTPPENGRFSTGFLAFLTINYQKESRVYSKLGDLDDRIDSLHLISHLATLKKSDQWKNYQARLNLYKIQNEANK